MKTNFRTRFFWLLPFLFFFFSSSPLVRPNRRRSFNGDERVFSLVSTACHFLLWEKVPGQPFLFHSWDQKAQQKCAAVTTPAVYLCHHEAPSSSLCCFPHPFLLGFFLGIPFSCLALLFLSLFRRLGSLFFPISNSSTLFFFSLVTPFGFRPALDCLFFSTCCLVPNSFSFLPAFGFRFPLKSLLARLCLFPILRFWIHEGVFLTKAVSSFRFIFPFLEATALFFFFLGHMKGDQRWHVINALFRACRRRRLSFACS